MSINIKDIKNGSRCRVKIINTNLSIYGRETYVTKVDFNHFKWLPSVLGRPIYFYPFEIDVLEVLDEPT
jgi:hypothetical protein